MSRRFSGGSRLNSPLADNSPVTGDWRDWRPAIWLAMIGIAVMLLVSPFYWGAVFIGAAIGIAIRIQQRRKRAALAAAAPQGRRPGPRSRRKS
jgi:hypothetical protein